MRVLITGGAGFIGRHVRDHLTRLGHVPIVFDRSNVLPDSYYGDIRDQTHVTDACAHVEAVIHLAGVLGTQETIGNPRPAVQTNILGGLNVLEACHQYDLPLVYIAVGNHWMDNPYSISKTTTERLCRMYRAEHDLTVAVVRVMNAYGAGQIPSSPYGPSKVRKIMPAMICRALRGNPIEVYGDGEQIMDMVYVTDVAHSLIGALGTNADYECGTGVPTTVRRIAESVVAQCGGTITHLPMRPGEPAQSTVLADLDQQLTEATVSLEEGITRTARWLHDTWL